MKWFAQACAWENARRAAPLVVVLICCWAIPQAALAAQLQAYAIFEIAPSSDENAAAEKLKSVSLRNCLQLVVGRHARDVFVHIACDERDLNEGFLELSRVDGISRATVVLLKHE
jgi:hypothetical protein